MLQVIKPLRVNSREKAGFEWAPEAPRAIQRPVMEATAAPHGIAIKDKCIHHYLFGQIRNITGIYTIKILTDPMCLFSICQDGLGDQTDNQGLFGCFQKSRRENRLFNVPQQPNLVTIMQYVLRNSAKKARR